MGRPESPKAGTDRFVEKLSRWAAATSWSLNRPRRLSIAPTRSRNALRFSGTISAAIHHGLELGVGKRKRHDSGIYHARGKFRRQVFGAKAQKPCAAASPGISITAQESKAVSALQGAHCRMQPAALSGAPVCST